MTIPRPNSRSARRVVATLRQKSPLSLALGGAIYAAGLAHAVTALIHIAG